MPRMLHSVQVEQLSGPDLAGFLLALEPQGWVRSKAIIDRAAKSQVSMHCPSPSIVIILVKVAMQSE